MRKSHEQYLEEFKEKFPVNFNKIQKFEEIKGYKTPFFVYVNSIQFITTINMLLTGKFVSIKSSVNKHQFFIHELSQSHPNIYNNIIILSEYETAKTKILIQNKYGVCKMRPRVLYKGAKPSIQSAIDKNEYAKNIFKKVHNNFYNYDKLVYITKDVPIIITCPIHGDFNQLYSNHKKGHGCSKCGGDLISKSLTKTQEQYIKDAEQKHGDKYDYSLVDYKSDKLDVKIICKEHGIFT